MVRFAGIIVKFIDLKRVADVCSENKAVFPLEELADTQQLRIPSFETESSQHQLLSEPPKSNVERTSEVAESSVSNDPKISQSLTSLTHRSTPSCNDSQRTFFYAPEPPDQVAIMSSINLGSKLYSPVEGLASGMSGQFEKYASYFQYY